jgi:hypothetical protein
LCTGTVTILVQHTDTASYIWHFDIRKGVAQNNQTCELQLLDKLQLLVEIMSQHHARIMFSDAYKKQ